MGWFLSLMVAVSFGENLPSLQARVDALGSTGAVVEVEHGDWVLNESLFLPTGLTLRGKGPQSRLILAPNTLAPLLTQSTLTQGVSNIRIENLVLDGNSDRQTWSTNNWGHRFKATDTRSIDNIGVYLKSSTRIAFSNVTFMNFKNEALMAVGCAGLSIIQCRFLNNCQDGSPANDFSQGAIYFRNTTDSRLVNNVFRGCFEGGIVLGLGSHRNWLEGNDSADSPSGEGILIGASASNTVLGNRVARASRGGAGKGAGISVSLPIGLSKAQYPSTGNRIFSNYIEDTGGPGIVVMRADQTWVEGNRIFSANGNRNPGQGGLKLYQADECRVVSNRITGTVAGDPIIVQESKDTVFQGE